MAGKRVNYLTWDEYFISAVALASLRSIEKNEGACIVDEDNRILSIGSNQIPYSIVSKVPAEKFLEYTWDSVSNAFFNFKGKRSEFLNGTIYLSEFPTPEQAKIITQARLKRVVYLKDSSESEEKDITRFLLDKTHTDLIGYIDAENSIECYNDFLIELYHLTKKYLKQREGRITPEEYYMSMAILSSLRSKDPSTQVGSCIVDENGRIVSVGYNGAPQGIKDEEVPWHSNGEITGIKADIKDYYVIHAEINSLDNYRGQQDDLQKMKIYLTFSPCRLCTPRIGMSSPKEVIWLRQYGKIDFKEYDKWFLPSGTKYRSYNSEHLWDKESYKELTEETTRVIKKHIGKPGKMI